MDPGHEKEERRRRHALLRSKNLPVLIFTDPRLAMLLIRSIDPGYRVILLSSLYGMTRFAQNIFDADSGRWLSPVGWIVASVTAGPLLGVAFIYWFSSWTVWWGARLGGLGRPEGMRAAAAWSLAPSILFVPGTILMATLVGPGGGHMEALKSEGLTEGDLRLMIVFLAYLVAQIIMIVWSLRIHMVMTSVVLGVTPLRALLAGVIASVSMCIVILLALIPLSVVAVVVMVALGVEVPQ